MKIKDIVSSKQKFIGKKLRITVGFTDTLSSEEIIENIELLGDVISFTFLNNPRGGLFLSEGTITTVTVSDEEFCIISHVYSCKCQ